MTKKTTSESTHVVEFKLDATAADIRAVNVRFEVGRRLYNASLAEVLRRSSAMRKSPRWVPLVEQNKATRDELKKLETLKKPTPQQKKQLTAAKKTKTGISNEFKALRKEFGVSEYSLNDFSKTNKNACYFGDHLDANTVQKIDKRVMLAFDKWCFQSGGKPRFKGKSRAFKSLEGKTNKQGIRFLIGDDKKPTRLVWNGLIIPAILSRHDRDGYQSAALDLIADGKIALTRVLKKTVKGKEKLYAQVVLKGKPFVKAHHRAAFDKSKGQRVGLDLGVSSLAYYSKEKAGLLTGITEIKRMEKKLIKHQTIASRLLRLANPDNYKQERETKGRKTVSVYRRKKGKRDSIRTRHWLREKAIVTELHRKMAAKRKYMHDVYANEILACGNLILTEKISTKAWQKMFGKSINAFAPAHLMSVLKRKAENAGGKVENIDTWKAKLSQYDHSLDLYIKKKLSERVMLVGGKELVQRDLYSAYLAYCVDTEKNIVCRATAIEQWPGARLRLDAAVKHLKIAKGKGFVPSSAGIAQFEQVSRRAIAA